MHDNPTNTHRNIDLGLKSKSSKKTIGRFKLSKKFADMVFQKKNNKNQFVSEIPQTKIHHGKIKKAESILVPAQMTTMSKRHRNASALLPHAQAFEHKSSLILNNPLSKHIIGDTASAKGHRSRSHDSTSNRKMCGVSKPPRNDRTLSLADYYSKSEKKPRRMTEPLPCSREGARNISKSTFKTNCELPSQNLISDIAQFKDLGVTASFGHQRKWISLHKNSVQSTTDHRL